MLAKTHRLIAILWMLAATVCTLKTNEIYRCDDFANDVCTLPAPKDGRYTSIVPREKRDTWYDFGYYMYFHSRETPGLRVDFNRSLSSTERDSLEKSLVCEYELLANGQAYEGHLEGRRIDDNGFWCFDYLGMMLIKFQKKNGDVKAKPKQDFFPIMLRIKAKSVNPPLNVEHESVINLQLPEN